VHCVLPILRFLLSLYYKVDTSTDFDVIQRRPIIADAPSLSNELQKSGNSKSVRWPLYAGETRVETVTATRTETAAITTPTWLFCPETGIIPGWNQIKQLASAIASSDVYPILQAAFVAYLVIAPVVFLIRRDNEREERREDERYRNLYK